MKYESSHKNIGTSIHVPWQYLFHTSILFKLFYKRRKIQRCELNYVETSLLHTVTELVSCNVQITKSLEECKLKEYQQILRNSSLNF